MISVDNNNLNSKDMKEVKNFKDLTIKDKITYWIMFVLLGFGMALLITSLILPPLGEIDTQVIGVFGAILLFTATVLGLDLKYSNMISNISKRVEKIKK